MQQQSFLIKNQTGLHARPATMFVKKASGFGSKIRVVKGNQDIDAKSIISLLSMGAGKGDLITLITEGPDEKEAMTELLSLLESFND